MAAARKRHSPGARQKPPPRPRKKPARLLEADEITSLETRLLSGAPAPGSNPLASSISKEAAQQDPIPFVGSKLFEQLPVSQKTQRGLSDAKFTRMTAIQRAALPHALCGRDVLGAAKTGSGKTLAFLIPVVEKLFRMQWGAMDGVGAIIISPTRELAVQIFEELRKVGKHHSLSGGLLIGGRKGVDLEKDRVSGLNILVCTPGRLLQHMDETPNFECSQLQVLVLDEADRILDMGFASTLNAIIAQLPTQRQTLLFSATQTRSVQDLARLSLKDPEYLAVHAESAVATPARLQQTAMIIPLEEKLDMLWSFIKTHLHSKTLVFLSSCKQVKFVHESFKRLRPGVPIKCLHGRMKQAQRMLVFFKFCEEKHSVLFATDVAARGLDFPAVDWVVQVDCPEDVASYIHRAGRTARYTSGGRSVIFLSPSEKQMIVELQAAKIPIKVIKANQSKIQRVSGALAGLLSKDPDLKYMAQRAFVTYLRSIHIRPNKEIFDVTKLALEEYAVSLGLPTTPRIRFLKKGMKKSNVEDVDEAMRSSSDGEKGQGSIVDKIQSMDDRPSGVPKNEKKKTKLDRIFNRKNADVLSSAYERLRSTDGAQQAHDPKAIADSAGDHFLMRKRTEEGQDVTITVENSLGTRVNKRKRLKINPNRPAGQRFVFDDEGNAVPPLAAFAKEKTADQDGISTGDARTVLKTATQERYKKLKEDMRKRDQEDKLLEKRRLRERRNKHKQKGKEFESNENHSRVEHFDESDVDVETNNQAKTHSTKRYFSDNSDDSGGGNAMDNDFYQQKSTAAEPQDGRREFGKSERLPLAMQEDIALKMLKSRG